MKDSLIVVLLIAAGCSSKTSDQTSLLPACAVPMDSFPCETPFTTPPVLANNAEIRVALPRSYDRDLRDAGICGTALVWLLIGSSGENLKAFIKRPSGNTRLDAAAVRVARLMKFRPALNGTTPVQVWVDMPIAFRVDQCGVPVR